MFFSLRFVADGAGGARAAGASAQAGVGLAAATGPGVLRSGESCMEVLGQGR